MLTVEISDNLGHSATLATGPFAAGGSNNFTDLGVLFPEFSTLSVSSTSNQGVASSFLNTVSVSGAVIAVNAPTPINLTVKLTGSGFTQPGSTVVSAVQGLSSSSVAGAFTSASLTGTLDGTTVATQTITPPGAVNNTNSVAVGATYNAILDQAITGIANTQDNNFNLTANLAWTATPEPASLTLFAGLLLGCGGSAVLRSRKKVHKASDC